MSARVCAQATTRTIEIDPVTPLTIDVTDIGQARRMTVGGELDLTTSPTLRERILAELESGHDVALDMSAVGFVDSSALSMLVLVTRRAADLSTGLVLLEPLPAQMRRVLEVTGLLARLPITPATARPDA